MPIYKTPHHKRLLMTGYIIYATVEIERKIDNFLAAYFCHSEEKANQLKQYLLFTEKITFDAKKDIVSAVLKNSYKSFIELHPKFISQLSNIAPHRNIFAHLQVDDNLPILSFKKYVGGELKLRTYDSKVLSKLEIEINTVSDLLDTLLRETPPLP